MPEPSVEVDKGQFILLEAVAQAASAFEIPWLSTGAGGRVLLLERLLGLPPGRATEDLDFGVMVRSWDKYRALKDRICEDGRFHADPTQSQRLWCGEDAKLDLVPFGTIALPDGTIHWPSEEGVAMTVLGFQEAYDAAVRIMVNQRLAVPVATAPAMLLLKIIAWEARHVTSPGRDASDIAYILHYGEKIIGQDSFYEEYAEITEAVDWDLTLASARVFGMQIARLAQPRTRNHLLEILNREISEGEESMLVREVAAGVGTGSNPPTAALILLQQVTAGLAGKETT